MSRFYVCGKSKMDDLKGAFVCDREDDFVEFVSYRNLYKYIKAGIEIDGIQCNDKRIISVLPQTDKQKYKDLHMIDMKNILANNNKFSVEPTSFVSFLVKVPKRGIVGVEGNDNIVEICYKFSIVDFVSNFLQLELSCYCIDNGGAVSEESSIVIGNNNSYPLVEEFRWKLNHCSKSELHNVIIKYFGSLKNIIRLSTCFGAYYLNTDETDEFFETLELFTDDCMYDESFH